ncbi:YslB family protein [Listeria welshimeri]|nr:YslB family protein [Listeria welshimeri]MBC1679784.1 YslB family protein [Listeria welshimeri]MBC1769752.1 YslB family protein [Listeria welshimeri]MBC1859922.1 YslB family protein [Listeria welshimeri]MBC1959993.1 YslB family protein [Listeria welshimeri]
MVIMVYESGVSDMTENEQNGHEEHILVPSFGLDLLRNYLIPEILGDEAPHIMYWAGKDLARKFPLETLDEVADFFEKASWGKFSILKEKKDELRLLLQGEMVEARFTSQENPTFKLEAGFVAEQLQAQKKLYTESYDEVDTRKKQVTIIVKWDRKEAIDNEERY